MTEHLVTPDKEIEFGGKPYLLLGSFNTLRALQNAFNRDIIDLQVSILSMRQDEFSKLLAVALKASGYEMTEDKVGGIILDEYDMTKIAYAQLKADLMVWLSIAMTPKVDREKKRADLESILKQMSDKHSLGKTTDASA